MDKEKVLSLAKLARIEIEEDEAESLSGEFDAILNYVGEVKGVTSDQGLTSKSPTRNVLREDKDPHESGIYTEKLLAQSPARDGDYIKVKKIL